MNEDAIKAEARLFVLEAPVALLHASHHQVRSDPAASLERMRTLLLERARFTTFGELGPAYSDLMSAELELAIDAALAHQRAWLGLDEADP